MSQVNETVVYVAVAVGLGLALVSDEMQKKYLPNVITQYAYNYRQIAGAALVAGGAYVLMSQQQAKVAQETTSSTLPLPTDLQSSTINLSSF